MLETCTQYCPYCNEKIELVIDGSVLSQSYVEDCEVCCRPVSVFVEVHDEGQFKVNLRNENI